VSKNSGRSGASTPPSLPELPPISIAVSTGQGWPIIGRFVRAFEAAAGRVGGEVIIADGSGKPAPDANALAASTRWLTLPRSSVFQLRPFAIQASRAPIVALTEDHCIVPADWAEQILAAHAEYPDTPILGGAVDNAATESAADWACYFTVQARCLPPVNAEPRDRLNHANVSYKREALEHLESFDGLGMLDALQQSATASEVSDRPAARIDPRPLVFHVQSESMAGFIRENFHAGRTYGAFLRARGGARRWLRLVSTPAMPAARLVWVADHAARSRHRRHLATALPLSLVLLYAQATGQAIGLLTGPGNSPIEVGG
jgi:hypothetical protein